jgi:hypothetical protein
MNKEGHHDLTRKTCSRLSNSYWLTDAQINVIIGANLASDDNQDRSAIHFDNCAFQEGSARIGRCWHRIFTESDRFSKNSLRAFGRLLHTVQDFYSHSNWIELHAGYFPIPLWNLNRNSLPSGIYSGTWPEGKPKRCHRGVPSHEQLNKDNSESNSGKIIVPEGPNKGRSYYELAYETAYNASIVELSKFLAGVTGYRLVVSDEMK